MKKIYFGKNVTITNDDMSNMFKDNASLTSVYNIPDSVTNMDYSFSGCSALEDIGKLPSSLTTAQYTFNTCTNFNQKLDSLGFLNHQKLTDCTGIFLNNTNRTGIASFPTSITTATKAFANTKITEVNFNNNLSYQIQKLDQTFQDCKSLKTCNRIPSSVTNLNYSFKDSTLQELPTFNNSTCTMKYSFYQTNITKINKNLPETSHMQYCFANNKKLTTVEASCFHLNSYSNISNDTQYLFAGCSKLSTINGKLENVNNCSYAFQFCSSLESLNLKGITSCMDFIQDATNITSLSIEGRIVTCGPTITDKYSSISAFIDAFVKGTDNSGYQSALQNLINLLKNLKSNNPTINISGADFPVDVAIFQQLETTVDLPQNLYLSSFDLNKYNYESDDINKIITLTSPKSNFNNSNIILPSKYYINNTLYKIKSSKNLFNNASNTTKVNLRTVISSLSEYSSDMFKNQSNLKEFTFLKTDNSADLTTIPDSCFYNCSNVQFFNLDFLRSLTTIGANAFYNSINQDIQFNSDETITVNENAFYRKKKSIVTLKLNGDSSKKLDQSYYFEFPYNKQSGDSFDKQIHASFLIKNQNLDEPIKDMLDENVHIIKLINFNNNIINYIKSFTSPQFFEKEDGTIIDKYSDGFSIDTINLTDFKKIYVLSDSLKDGHNWAWEFYNLYWLVFERVNKNG